MLAQQTDCRYDIGRSLQYFSSPVPKIDEHFLFTSHSPIFTAGADIFFVSRMSHNTILVVTAVDFEPLWPAAQFFIVARCEPFLPAPEPAAGRACVASSLSWKTFALTTYSHPSLTGVST